MVKSYWELNFDPFTDAQRAGPFVPIPTHVAAVARLRHAIESGDRHATLVAEAGMGKSRVLHEALARSRSARRRIVRLPGPPDRSTLHHELARALGLSSNIETGDGTTWRDLTAALRVVRLQNLAIVIAIDDVGKDADHRDIERLQQLADHTATRLTMLRARRPASGSHSSRDWDLTLSLPPLTRDETAFYVHAKLAAAGRSEGEAIFSERALTYLHALAVGNPRGVNRLASLALRDAALRSYQEITADLLDEVATECQTPDAA